MLSLPRSPVLPLLLLAAASVPATVGCENSGSVTPEDGTGTDSTGSPPSSSSGPTSGGSDTLDGTGSSSGGSDSSSGEPPGFDCDATPPIAPESPTGLELQTEWGSPEELEVVTNGIWAIWWYPQFDHADDAQWLFGQLNDIRCRSLTELAMQDPPNPGNGVYYNVYLHHGAEDDFPEGWGNGQGTDSFGNPFLTLPDGAHLDEGNIGHEGFHVFQYSANSPGFAYSGDSQWYIESSAQWYAAWRRPTAEDAFIEAGAIDGNPHLALWHSFSNEAPGDPTDWMFQVRQYGMHTYLYYLTEEAGLSRDIITAGFYGMVPLSPQNYHYEQASPDALRGIFADWGAHNTADFDYLTPEQVQRARLEVQAVGDPKNTNPYVAVLSDEGTTGAVRPPAALTPRGWGYNVVRIDNTAAATYELLVVGDATGSEGAASHFEVRVVLMRPEGAEYIEATMDDALTGSASATVGADVTEVYLVVAAVPEHFGGNQTYGYEYTVTRR